MKRLLAAILLVALFHGFQRLGAPDAGVPGTPTADAPPSAPRPVDDALLAAIRDGRSDVQVTGEGRVARVLADDDRGSRHQRFILELPSGDTVLVAHNIDLAPRIATLRAGDDVAFHGEYAWNDKGGVIHWTHHDPAGRHADGWLRHDGRTYR